MISIKSSTGLSSKFPVRYTHTHTGRECVHMVLMNSYAACLPVRVSMSLCVRVYMLGSVICSCCFYWINDARVAADSAAGVAELPVDFSLSLYLSSSVFVYPSLSPSHTLSLPLTTQLVARCYCYCFWNFDTQCHRYKGVIRHWSHVDVCLYICLYAHGMCKPCVCMFMCKSYFAITDQA